MNTPRPKLIILLIAVLLLSVLSYVYARPTYRAVKAWRAQYIADQALSALDAGNADEALKKANSAYKLFPYDVKVLRIMALVYDVKSPENALDYWRTLVDETQALDDRKSFMRAALRLREWSFVEEQLKIIKELNQFDDDVELIEINKWISDGRWAEALAAMKKMASKPNPLPDGVMFYAQMSFLFKAEQVFAVKQLMKLAENNMEYRTEALRLALSLHGLSGDDLIQLEMYLKQNGDLDMNDQLAIAAYKYKFQGGTKSQSIQEAKALFDLNDAAQLVVLGRWLNQQSWADEVMSLVTLEKALKRQDLFLVWLDAKALLNDWEDIRIVLQKEKVPLEKHIKLLFEARTYDVLGNKKKAEATWNSVYATIGNDPEKLLYVLQYVSRLGKDDLVRRTFQELASITTTMRAAFYNWVIWEKNKGETWQVYKLLEEIRTKGLGNVSITNDWIYTRLLLDESTIDCLIDAQALVKESPAYLSHQVTLALAYFKNGRRAEAYQTLQAANIDQYELIPAYKAVYVAVLRDNKMYDKADKLVKTIPLDRLLPEERALLED